MTTTMTTHCVVLRRRRMSCSGNPDHYYPRRTRPLRKPEAAGLDRWT